MRVNGDLAGASSVAVHRGGHFLSVKQCNDFLLGRNELPALRLLQRLADEVGKHFDVCAREQLLNPEGTTGEERVSCRF